MNIISTIIILLLAIIPLYFLRKYFRGPQNTKKHSMKGKFIIITGASSGLGLHSALDLIESGAKVIFACRNEQKAKKAINMIKNLSLKQNAEFLEIDLCNFNSIENFSKKIIKNYPKIDILMNNAGAGPTNYSLTSDGYEYFFQGNYLGPCLLTLLLIDHFNNNESRIIFLGSVGHYISTLKKEDLKYFNDQKLYKENICKSIYAKFLGQYCSTKLLLMLFSKYLAKYCNENKKYNNIKIVSCHPGVCDTNFTNFLVAFPLIKYPFLFVYPIFHFLTKTPNDGAQTQLYLCYLDFKELKNGGYYCDCHESSTSEKASDLGMINEFSEWTIKELNKKYELSIKV